MPGLDFELVYDDGLPLETYFHHEEIVLLADLTHAVMAAKGRSDFFTGGNQFVFFSVEHARQVAEMITRHGPFSDKEPPAEYRKLLGPDWFFVDHVADKRRKAWVVWEEEDRYPDIIVELLSPSTRKNDETVKKRRYEQIFKTPEYYLYEPEADEFRAYRLGPKSRYRKVQPNKHGRVWSEVLGVWLGIWYGRYHHGQSNWLRFFDNDGLLIPTSGERAEKQRLRAEQAETDVRRERQRADHEQREREVAELRAMEAQRERDAARAEIARLRALLDAQ